MKGDRRFTIYYAWLSLFTASMLNLVIADNLFQLLVGWELVGICSYLLIGHWWEEKENSERRHQGVHHHEDRRRAVPVRHLRADPRGRDLEHPGDHGEGRPPAASRSGS